MAVFGVMVELETDKNTRGAVGAFVAAMAKLTQTRSKVADLSFWMPELRRESETPARVIALMCNVYSITYIVKQ